MELTAVEWLKEQYYESEGKLTKQDFEQAKEMDKQNLINAVNETMQEMNSYESFRTFKNGEQYYNETFKNK